MATPKALTALKTTKEALNDIKAKLEPVVQCLRDDAFETATAQAQATVSLSIGMMKYMSARLQGLDHGRKPDDPLRIELNQMRKVLADIKARKLDDKKSEAKQQGKSTTSPQEHPSTKTLPAKRKAPKTDLNEAKSKVDDKGSLPDTSKQQHGKRKPQRSERPHAKKPKSN